MRIAVITIAAGRHDHLRRQYAGLQAGRRRPDHHVVVAMGDPNIAGVPGRSSAATVVSVSATTMGLPLATARNAGARATDAELLVFLDVDCIPGPGLLDRYEQAAQDSEHGAHVLCGPVHYLPPAPASGYDLQRLPELADPHPARPAPPDGVVLPGEHQLFWSLSFAVRSTVWATVGGFCEDYVGYGGEDTDFAESAAAAGVGLRWVGGATAYHQHHPVSQPPVEHLDDVLRNGELFRRRWGWWPMQGWLEGFARLGLVRHDPRTDTWLRTAP
ncbi:glycosyltransferase [soil metagenome]